MPYKIKKLKSFSKNVFSADKALYALSPKAADNFFNDYSLKSKAIEKNPYMYQAFDDDPYFRSAPLLYGYRLFYHIDDLRKLIIFHRVIHGAWDLATHLANEKH